MAGTIEQNTRPQARASAIAVDDMAQATRALVQPYAVRLAAEVDELFIAGESHPATVPMLRGSGLAGLTIPRRHGGQGMDYTAMATAAETLCAIDGAHQIAFTVHMALTSMAILHWGTAEQHTRWLPPLASGTELGTFGLTEPGVGSDVGNLAMRARRVDGGWLLNGEKSWISAATYSTVFLLFATVDPAARHKGITAFIVPRETPGLTTTTLHGKLGLRAGDTGSVFCTDAFVPDDDVLGNVSEGFVVALATLGNGLFTVGAGALGIATETRSILIERLRELGVTDLGADADELAAMTARIEAGRVLLERATALKNAGHPNGRETGLAKWQCANAGYENAGAAIRVLQGYEATEHLALQRHQANARGAIIFGGTNEIHQGMQGSYALDYRRDRPFRLPTPTAADLTS